MPRKGRRSLNLSKRSITFRPTIDQFKHILDRCKVRGITFSAYMRSLVGDDIDRYVGVTKVIYSSSGAPPPVPGSDDDNRLRKRREERAKLASGLGAFQVEAVDLIKREILAGVTLKKVREETRRPLSEEERMDLRLKKREGD